MIFEDTYHQRASYDSEGNIIIPGGLTSSKTSSTVKLLTFFQEEILFVRHDVCTTGRKILRFLQQPVIAPNFRSKPKEYSRWQLFLFDVGRFGGTFALLFSVLFLTLNYQSFFQLTKAYVNPVQAMQSSEAFSHAKDATSNVGLLAVLPLVGPPDHRLIIPKLDLNVPISIPAHDALLAEDWKKLENDIQDALENGVVHYPGTARPGQAGNFFLTGHSSYYPWAAGNFKSVFAKLGLLDVGDEYWVYYNGDRYRYRIKEKKEVRPSNVGVLDQPLDKRLSTLMTCTPVGTTLRRLILVAEELDPKSGTSMRVGEKTERNIPKIRPQELSI
ncbi:hypothetical protein A3D11_04195 [Candidatus Peribacteria bacterium RIFCSPHIGHO2_02_FULL_49_16]|nr:MAG: hypothetical protein A2880_00285 [Candidatus Peribacteria bacterium RIFCSPHIGHO2_01_FULL_49_38]OGJ59198.1 MAG: hypothetical protein A3D11_04195 [Candidatus Peribacteria bacterium RIFCSPHIGHO2_02_FULL_49_16]